MNAKMFQYNPDNYSFELTEDFRVEAFPTEEWSIPYHDFKVEGSYISDERNALQRAWGLASYKKYYENNRDKVKIYNRNYNQNNREVQRAKATVYRAIKNGRMARPAKCSKCHQEHPNIQGHHADYSQPLEVLWLCPSCHKKEHGYG